MCFSASASFVVATTLASVGALSLVKARTKSLTMAAFTPILLAIQQACEGLVWLRINSGDFTSTWFKIGVYGFQFFAGVVWPLWIPLTLYFIEHRTKNKKFLGLCTIIGSVICIIILAALWQSPASVQVVDHHLRYPLFTTQLKFLLPSLAEWETNAICYLGLTLYTIVVVGSCFISTFPGVRILGILFALGFIMSMLGYQLAFASVWCFFAAISSITIYGIITYHNRQHSYK